MSTGLSDQAPRIQYQPPEQYPLGFSRPALLQNWPERHGVQPLQMKMTQNFSLILSDFQLCAMKPKPSNYFSMMSQAIIHKDENNVTSCFAVLSHC